MERTINIKYRWWKNGGEIKPEHVDALEERAEDRIKEQMSQGFTSGELVDNIRMIDNDPEDGIEYSGWWEVKRTWKDY